MQSPLFLALDTASPVVSLALGDGQQALVRRSLELRRSSEQLLASIADALKEAGTDLRALRGIAVLRGPGSFTGLRVGLATALGLHEATGLPAIALPTLKAIAEACATEGEEVLAAVDALRGDWYGQRFERRQGRLVERGEARLRSTEELASGPATLLAGFGVQELRERLPSTIDLRQPPPLAAAALRLAAAPEASWDASLLTRPIYFRPPAVTAPTAG